MYSKDTLIPLSIPLADQSFLDSRGSFYVGGTYLTRNENTYLTGQMYVEVYVPKQIRHPYPLVFLHGAAQTGLCWMSTPDGRPGWTDFFLKKGYVVYVTDQPERGRSACHLDLHPDRLLFPVSSIEAQFTAPDSSHRGGYLQKEPARRLRNLLDIPALVMTAEASYHAPFDYLTYEFLKQAGVDADYLYLPDVGIRGNGHMMMLEKNSDDVAAALQNWMEHRRL